MRLLQATPPRLLTRRIPVLSLAVSLQLLAAPLATRAANIDFGLSVAVEIIDRGAHVQKFSVDIRDLVEIQDALGLAPDRNLLPQSSSTVRSPRQPLVSAFLQIRLTDRIFVNPEVIFQRTRETGHTRDDASRFGPDAILIPTTNPLAFGRTHTAINVWEFPILVKYNFTTARRSPFVAAGPTFWVENPDTLRSRSSDPHYGITAAFGYNLPWRRWHLTPQVRYTRWAGRGYALISHDYASSLPKNQIRAMLGFTF